MYMKLAATAISVFFKRILTEFSAPLQTVPVFIEQFLWEPYLLFLQTFQPIYHDFVLKSAVINCFLRLAFHFAALLLPLSYLITR